MISIFQNKYQAEPIEKVMGSEPLTMDEIYDVVTLRRPLKSMREGWDRIRPSLNEWPFTVKKLRETEDDKEYVSLKGKLPAFTFIGTMENRTTLKQLSGYYAVDIDDDKENAGIFKSMGRDGLKRFIIENIPSVCLAFVSPGGGGLKVVHKLQMVGDVSDVKYAAKHFVYPAFEDTYAELGVVIDDKCVDFNRLCFFGYDREAYYNPGCDAFVQGVTAEPVEDELSKAIRQAAVVQKAAKYGRQVRTYKKSNKKSTCPHCGHRDRFRAFVDAMTNEPIADAGYCDRQNSCPVKYKTPYEADKGTWWEKEK